MNAHAPHTLLTPQPARHPTPTVKASSLAYLIFERPDLDKAADYLTDFGLQVCRRDDQMLYLRGTASAPYCYRIQHADKPRFVGFGLAVNSRSDLEKIARLPGASAITTLTAPGAG